MRVELRSIILVLLLSIARGTEIGTATRKEDLKLSTPTDGGRITDRGTEVVTDRGIERETESQTIIETERITEKGSESEEGAVSEKKEEYAAKKEEYSAKKKEYAAPPKLRGSRQLSASTDLRTGETVRTYNSNVPFVTCPIGYYRPPGSTNLHMVTGQRADGCRPCARGKYGTTDGTCVSCPKGTFGDRIAVTTIADCHRCPPGTYGTKIGLTNSVCNSACPSGFYSTTYGNTDISSCVACPDTFQGWQCVHSIYPRSAADPDNSKWQNIEGTPAVQAVPLPKNS